MDAGNPQIDVMNALKALPVRDHAPARVRLIRDRAVARLAGRGRPRFESARQAAHISRFLESALAVALAFSLVAWTTVRTIDIVSSAHGGFFWP